MSFHVNIRYEELIHYRPVFSDIDESDKSPANRGYCNIDISGQKRRVSQRNSDGR